MALHLWRRFKVGVTPMQMLVSFMRDESGVSATEYVLLLAIIGAGIMTGIQALGGAIKTELQAAGTALAGAVPAAAS